MADKIVLSWSGGKDSAMALERIIYNGGYQAAGLFTVYSEETGKVKLHNVPIELIRLQAESLRLPLYEIALPEKASNESYEAAHLHLFDQLKQEGIHQAAFGDLFLEPIRQYRDQLADKAGMQFYYPLWRQDTNSLAEECIKRGFNAVITAIDMEKLPGSMLGRQYDESFIKDLPENVDLCGENGEFHSFVWDGPIFNAAIAYQLGEKYEEDYRPAVNVQMKFIEISPA